MFANLEANLTPWSVFKSVVSYFQRPFRLFRTYDPQLIRTDLAAALTTAVVAIPQVMAFALIAELPPQMGLYAAIVGAVFAALWGSSNQMFTGPTNSISLLVLSSLGGTIVAGSDIYILAAGLMAVMVGVLQLLMGLGRLGFLVNFVSHSVIVGFATGAGILIAIQQIPPLLGLRFPSSSLLESLRGIVLNLPATHWQTAVLGLGALLVILLLRRYRPQWPAAIVVLGLASLVVWLFRLDEAGVRVIGELPKGFPPLADLPLLDLGLISRISTGALAVGAIALVQTVAITRSIAAQTSQRLDSNQEFVGQGVANIFSGLFSGYVTSGSFSITAVNFKAGAKSPFASLFTGLFVLIALFTLGPVTAYLPRTALAGTLIITAYGMINFEEIGRIWRGARGDAMIMIVTLLGTLFLKIEFAVLAGILLSFTLYIMRTSIPTVVSVLPDDSFKHFTHQPGKKPCPQLSIIEIRGDLYFGAVSHVEEAILSHMDQHPEQRFLLVRMHHVNQCDFSGIHMLETIVRSYRERKGDVFFVRANETILELMDSTGFKTVLGTRHFLPEDEAISDLFHHTLDPTICIYECPVKAFKECQNLPKRVELVNIPHHEEVPDGTVLDVLPHKLWQQLHNGQGDKRPFVVDVREPREYKRGHIAEARLIPLPTLLSDEVKLPNDRQIIFVCRSGRRSRRAAYALQHIGCMNVAILAGGMLAWEAEGLLEAVE